MTNIFEQPWLLLIVSGVVLLAVVVFRGLFPQRHRWWFWLLPVIIVIAAFAIDFFVRTDAEKVRDVIAKAVKAVEKEDAEAIGPLISNDYHDSFHASRQALLDNFRGRLSEPIIEKNVYGIVSLDVRPPNATAVFTVRVVFDPQGPIYEYRKIMLFKLQAGLRKEGAKWLFTHVEVLGIDLQPANWQHIQGGAGEILN
jgi:hypothetical protein